MLLHRLAPPVQIELQPLRRGTGAAKGRSAVAAGWRGAARREGFEAGGGVRCGWQRPGFRRSADSGPPPPRRPPRPRSPATLLPSPPRAPAGPRRDRWRWWEIAGGRGKSLEVAGGRGRSWEVVGGRGRARVACWSGGSCSRRQKGRARSGRCVSRRKWLVSPWCRLRTLSGRLAVPEEAVVEEEAVQEETAVQEEAFMLMEAEARARRAWRRASRGARRPRRACRSARRRRRGAAGRAPGEVGRRSGGDEARSDGGLARSGRLPAHHRDQLEQRPACSRSTST